jgi:hypothetical protein
MRIEEMRSGRAYLSKRVGVQAVQAFESRDLRHVFEPAPRVEDEAEIHIPTLEERSEPRIDTDLDKNQWTLVSFNGVEAGGLTYRQAARLMEVLGENGIHGLCIITDAAALNID